MPIASPPHAQPIGLCGRHTSVRASSTPRRFTRRALALGLGLSSVVWTGAASALPEDASTWTLTTEGTTPTGYRAPTAKESPTNEAATPPVPPFQLGALAGVGFPRPVSFEVLTKLGGYVGLGAEYGLLPSMTFSGIATSTWAASGDLRVFPFRGAFFVGFRGGYQHIDADASVTVSGLGSASASASMNNWFINPRLGFLWTVKYGFTLAMEAGVQVPVSSSFSSTLPAAVALDVRESTPVRTLSGVLPTVDLLRIGMMF